jgi:rhomboid protease GluP
MRTLLGRSTPVTTILLIVIVLVFVADVLTGLQLSQLGADKRSLVLAGEWWRPFTSMFLHGGLLHLVLNAWVLYQLGSLCEILLGSSQMSTVYLVSGLAGSFASLWWHDGWSVGASGAIFGLMGALIAFLLRRRGMLTPSAKSLLGQLVMWAGINVYLGMSMPRIDLAAHFGGFVMGFLLGLVLKGRELHPQPQPLMSQI